MNLFKPILLYFLFYLLFIISLLIISIFTEFGFLEIFSAYNLYFNILFSTLFFFIFNDLKISVYIIFSIVSLFVTLFLCEVIYPSQLKDNIVLNKNNKKIINSKNYDININKNDDLDSNKKISSALSYYNNGEYISAWLLSDSILEIDKNNIEALNIKKNSFSKLNKLNEESDNIKYLDTIKYKKIVDTNDYLGAYYFILDKSSNQNYDHDHYIKLKSAYSQVIKEYYSINSVESSLNNEGYSDIKFYYENRDVILYKIEKLVEINNEYFLQNVTINNDFYPYLYINKDNKIFSSGFNEDFRFVYNLKTPFFPLKFNELKLFSKELYPLSKSSLYFNIKMLKMTNIVYFEENSLLNLIVTRFSGYLLIIIIYFMCFKKRKYNNYFNFFISYCISLFSIRWVIKKIGLIFLNYSLGLSFVAILLLFTIWLFTLIKKN